jgi:hypothetical protein
VRPRWLLVVLSFALVVIGGAVGYLVRGDRGRTVRTRAGVTALARERLNAARQAEYSNAVIDEILAFEGARAGPPGNCSSQDFPSIHVAFLSPRNGSRVRSPLTVHLLTERPLGCYSEYYIDVDGKPFEEAPPASPRADVLRPPESRGHPMATRLVPRGQRTPPNAACLGGAYQYLRFDLPPGRHVIAIAGGCEQGTEVPQPARSAVRFTVLP